ncbi:MAG: flavodoxin family protein [Mycobacteriales bacterium]
MLEAALGGLRQEGLEGVETMVRPALTCSPVEALEADAVVLGTTANMGYMSGALKHFFDQLYYLGLDVMTGRPYALWVHGDNDATGAVRSVEKVADALQWRKVAEPVCVIGQPDAAQRASLEDLAATVAATALGS